MADLKIPDELWLMEATPTDPTKPKFYYGLGELKCMAENQVEAEQLAAESRPLAIINGVSDVRPVRVK